MAKRPEPPFNPLFKDRKNPYYPPWHCMTVVQCKECGEMYEPICRIDHECKKANSYPYEGVDLLDDADSIEEESLMSHKDAVKWLESLKKAISQSQFSSLWNFEEPLDKIIEMLDSECEK